MGEGGREGYVSGGRRGECVGEGGVCEWGKEGDVSVDPCPPPRDRVDPRSISYSYQLWSCNQDGFESSQAEFRHRRVEEYNWNYLDQHVCGYPDFEVLGEVSGSGRE